MENLVDRARFLGEKSRLSAEELDAVCQTYFVKQSDIADYDTHAIAVNPDHWAEPA